MIVRGSLGYFEEEVDFKMPRHTRSPGPRRDQRFAGVADAQRYLTCRTGGHRGRQGVFAGDGILLIFLLLLWSLFYIPYVLYFFLGKRAWIPIGVIMLFLSMTVYLFILAHKEVTEGTACTAQYMGSMFGLIITAIVCIPFHYKIYKNK